MVTAKEKEEFEKITAENLYKVKKYLEEPKGRLCDYTLGGLYMWSGFYNTRYAIVHGGLVLSGERNGEKIYTLPTFSAGERGTKEKIEKIIEEISQNEKKICFFGVTEEEKALLSDIYGERVTHENDAGWDDYLYSAEQFRTYAGKKNHAKKNHINKFIKENPDYTFEKITEANIADAQKFYCEFKKSNPKDSESGKNEGKATEHILENYLFDTLTGGILKAGGEVAGITVGETAGDTLFVHIEKADAEKYEGVYPMIASEFAKMNASATYINREEDDGDEGLRRSKLSYNPIALLKKYKAEILL